MPSNEMILSNHLPPAYNMTDELLQCLSEVPSAKPFTGPDQQAFRVLQKGKVVKATINRALATTARRLLSAGRYLQLATITLDDKPSLRNIAFVIYDNKTCFLTGYASDKY